MATEFTDTRMMFQQQQRGIEFQVPGRLVTA